MNHRILAGAFAVLFLASGCATSPDGSTPNILSDLQTLGSAASPEQEALRKQAGEHRDYAKARVQAAATGAVVGGLIGALFDRRNRVRGAAAGAAVGGTAGYIGATYLTRDHAQFVASQEALEEDIKVANELTISSQTNVEVAQAALDWQRTEITRLNAEYRVNQDSAEGYERKLASIAEDRNSVQSMISTTEEQIAKMETSIDAYRQAGLGTETLAQATAAQKRDLANLRRIENAMVGLIAGAPEGIKRPDLA